MAPLKVPALPVDLVFYTLTHNGSMRTTDDPGPQGLDRMRQLRKDKAPIVCSNSNCGLVEDLTTGDLVNP